MIMAAHEGKLVTVEAHPWQFERIKKQSLGSHLFGRLLLLLSSFQI
jgi:hypothetical protein